MATAELPAGPSGTLGGFCSLRLAYPAVAAIPASGMNWRRVMPPLPFVRVRNCLRDVRVLRAWILLRDLFQRQQRLDSGLDPGCVSIPPGPALVREVGFGLEQVEESSGAHGQTGLSTHYPQQPIHGAADMFVINAAHASQSY